jgi:hypothetical protein
LGLSDMPASEKERVCQGYIGYTHASGSISGEKQALYARHQLLYQLRSLLQNDFLYRLVSKIAVFLPAKPLVSYAILFLTAAKNGDFKLFNTISYVLSKKKVP